MGKSIFELSDKYGYDSPFENWVSEKLISEPRIESILVLNSEYGPFINSVFNQNKNQSSKNIIALKIEVYVINHYADKIEIEFKGRKIIANFDYSISSNDSYGYKAYMNIEIPAMYESENYTFTALATDKNQKKIIDRRSLTVNINLNGIIKNLPQAKVKNRNSYPENIKSQLNSAKVDYKDLTFEGSTFPGSPYNYDVKIKLSNEIQNEYIPTLEKDFSDSPRGLKILITIMANVEGFKKGTRSYRNNNPGNIGNTDSGANNKLPSLTEGIKLQKEYVEKVSSGKHSAYPMNKPVKIKPYYSKEIAKNEKTYGISPYLPGYNFVYTGQLDQYAKIYSTGARGGNSYINSILSYFKLHDIYITPESKIQDIIVMT